jgi:hypothetical protein
VRVAELLRGVHKISHNGKVCTDFDGRKAHTNAQHHAPPVTTSQPLVERTEDLGNPRARPVPCWLLVPAGTASLVPHHRIRNVRAFNLLLDRLPEHLGVGVAILLWLTRG